MIHFASMSATSKVPESGSKRAASRAVLQHRWELHGRGVHEVQAPWREACGSGREGCCAIVQMHAVRRAARAAARDFEPGDGHARRAPVSQDALPHLSLPCCYHHHVATTL